MQFIPNYLPYPSVRYPIYARNGMVCASSPQAAAAGLEAMKKGGNAMDAAVADVYKRQSTPCAMP